MIRLGAVLVAVIVSGCIGADVEVDPCLHGFCLEEQTNPEVLAYAQHYGLTVMPWRAESTLESLANDHFLIQVRPSDEVPAYTLIAYNISTGRMHAVTTATEGSVGHYEVHGDTVSYTFRGKRDETIWVENIATGEKTGYPLPFGGRFMIRNVDAPWMVLWHTPGNVSMEKFYLFNWETQQLDLIKNHTHDRRYRTPEGAVIYAGGFDIKGPLVLMPQAWNHHHNNTRHNFVDLYNATSGETTRVKGFWSITSRGYSSALVTDDWFYWALTSDGPDIGVYNRSSGKFSFIRTGHPVSGFRELDGMPAVITHETDYVWSRTNAIFPEHRAIKPLLEPIAEPEAMVAVISAIKDQVHVEYTPNLQHGYGTVKNGLHHAILLGPAAPVLADMREPPPGATKPVPFKPTCHGAGCQN